jgi:hypothetical protein
MDEKQSFILTGILGRFHGEVEGQKSIELKDWLHEIEQAFLSSGYVKVQPAEGELVENPYIEGKSVKELTSMQIDLARAYERGKIDVLAQGYRKLPSEDELDEMLGGISHLPAPRNRLLAQQLLELLKGGKNVP